MIKQNRMEAAEKKLITMHPFLKKCLMVFLCTLLSGCGGMESNDLKGSIGEVYSLDFDKVEIQKLYDSLVVLYLRQDGTVAHKVVKLVIDTEGLDIKKGSTIKGDLFKERVVLSRQVEEEKRFPDIVDGHSFFEKYNFVPAGRVSGEFTIEFDDGRNLLGNFDAKVKDITPID